MKKSILAIVASAALTFGAACTANATAINFNDVGGVYSTQTTNGPAVYTYQGFVFTAVTPTGDTEKAHFHQNLYYTGSVYLHDNSSSRPDTWLLTSTSGLFDLISFTTASSNLSWSTDGGLYKTTVAGLNTINLAGVTSLTFKLTNPSSAESLRQIVTGANTAQAGNVPEPGSLALLGLGFGFMALRRRKAA